MVSADASILGSDFSQVGTDCGAQDLTACRADLQQTHDDAVSFVNDLDQNPAPPCLQTADSQLREALINYENGTTTAIQGIDDLNASEITAGTQMIDSGNAEMQKATTAVQNATC